MSSAFPACGYLEPERILRAEDCRSFLVALERESRPAPEWPKGEAAVSSLIFELATHEKIITRVASLLGDDVMLWGARLIARAPGSAHPWHSDIETWTETPARFVSVWLALENTTRESSLRIVSFSHLFGVTVQQVRHERGKGREDLSDDEIVAWARARDSRSQAVSLDVSEGEALFFDGHIWHCTRNATERTRKVLLLQYATPSTVVRVPDLLSKDWPFRFFEQRPPCLMVRGTDRFGVNHMVDAPSAAATAPAPPSNRLASGSRTLELPLEPEGPGSKNGWRPYRCFHGETRSLDFFGVHASALEHGRCPHPPHRHLEEELLLVLGGEVEVNLPDVAERPRLRPGDIVYYPATFAHTVTAVSASPASYFMVKWCDRSAKSQTEPTLPFVRFNYREANDPANHRAGKNGFSLDVVFEGATLYLHKLHCHYSALMPGGGYEPHVDPYDVVLLVLEGEVETLGQRLGSHAVIFYAAGEPHGIHNPGSVTARYLVFEFHGRRGPAPKGRRPPQSLASKLVDPAAWRRLLANVRSRLS